MFHSWRAILKSNDQKSVLSQVWCWTAWNFHGVFCSSLCVPLPTHVFWCPPSHWWHILMDIWNRWFYRSKWPNSTAIQYDSRICAHKFTLVSYSNPVWETHTSAESRCSFYSLKKNEDLEIPKSHNLHQGVLCVIIIAVFWAIWDVLYIKSLMCLNLVSFNPNSH